MLLHDNKINAIILKMNINVYKCMIGVYKSFILFINEPLINIDFLFDHILY